MKNDHRRVNGRDKSMIKSCAYYKENSNRDQLHWLFVNSSLFLCDIKYAFISSGLFPFVSGTTNTVNMAQQKDTDAYKKYVPELLIRLEMFVENLVTFGWI